MQPKDSRSNDLLLTRLQLELTRLQLEQTEAILFDISTRCGHAESRVLAEA